MKRLHINMTFELIYGLRISSTKLLSILDPDEYKATIKDIQEALEDSTNLVFSSVVRMPIKGLNIYYDYINKLFLVGYRIFLKSERYCLTNLATVPKIQKQMCDIKERLHKLGVYSNTPSLIDLSAYKVKVLGLNLQTLPRELREKVESYDTQLTPNFFIAS